MDRSGHRSVGFISRRACCVDHAPVDAARGTQKCQDMGGVPRGAAGYGRIVLSAALLRPIVADGAELCK